MQIGNTQQSFCWMQEPFRRTEYREEHRYAARLRLLELMHLPEQRQRNRSCISAPVHIRATATLFCTFALQICAGARARECRVGSTRACLMHCWRDSVRPLSRVSCPPLTIADERERGSLVLVRASCRACLSSPPYTSPSRGGASCRPLVPSRRDLGPGPTAVFP